VSRYQKGKTNRDFTEARDSEWQWHQLGHMQVCILLQTDNHASTPPLFVFYRPDALPATQPTASKHWKQLATAGPRNVELFWVLVRREMMWWQWHQLTICTSLQADNHASTSSSLIITGRMLLPTTNQQCQSTGSHVLLLFSFPGESLDSPPSNYSRTEPLRISGKGLGLDVLPAINEKINWSLKGVQKN